MDDEATLRYDLAVEHGAGYHRDELAELTTEDAVRRAGAIAEGMVAVPFEAVLVDADPPADVTHVTFEALDGYAVSIPLERAASDAVLLVPRHDDPRQGVRLVLLDDGEACMNVKAVVRVDFSEGPGRHTVDPNPHRNQQVPGWDT
ncbi:MAG TPA: hypothetical protein VM840_03965 [Actinomycetota bacterium]|nr:hypothetical protein [Actinomycetota bacterium]